MLPGRIEAPLAEMKMCIISVAPIPSTIDRPVAYAPGDVNAGANPHIAGSAYTNPDNDLATGTTLYDLDAVQDTLVLQNPPNAGTLTTLGPLGINIDNSTGFDISHAGPDYIATNIPGDTSSKLYTYPSGVENRSRHRADARRQRRQHEAALRPHHRGPRRSRSAAGDLIHASCSRLRSWGPRARRSGLG